MAEQTFLRDGRWVPLSQLNKIKKEKKKPSPKNDDNKK